MYAPSEGTNERMATGLLDQHSLEAEFDEHLAVALATKQTLAGPVTALARRAADRIEAGGKIVFFGNGGSAADAQHLATELTIRFRTNRRALPAIALTTDSSALTACGNDFGFDQIFSRQVEALVRSDDMVFGISTSGTSANVLRGLTAARAAGALTVGLTGSNGDRLNPLRRRPGGTLGRHSAHSRNAYPHRPSLLLCTRRRARLR